MSFDIYGPCPCGSGKKFKFCCHPIADEMDRVIRLMEGNQPRVALQQMEILAKKYPTNAWVGTTFGMLLLDLNDGALARDVLRRVLEEHSDNELAIVLYAAAMVQAEGFENAKRAIHRAFQKSAKKLPALVSDLATSLAQWHASNDRMMAVREHLGLALRLAEEEKRQQLFVQLLELDGADEIPYPLRGSHQLPSISATDDVQMEVRKGQKYAAVGCWSVAADVFTSLANANPDCAQYWHSAGLCRAWDGDEKLAAEALHRAARHYSDIGIAVECETIAQLLDERTTTNLIEHWTYQAQVHSVSRLLTLLDSNARMRRVKNPPQMPGSSFKPDGVYFVIDREFSDNDVAALTLDNAPLTIAQITIFDADAKEGASPSLVLAGHAGTELEDAKSLLTSAAGDLIEWKTDRQPYVEPSGPKEALILENHLFLSDAVPVVRRRELLNEFWQRVLNEKWTNQPLEALDGKTPFEALGNEALRVPLYGAAYALDSAAQQHSKGYALPTALSRLGLAPLPKLTIGNETNVSGLSVLQMHRLPLDQLTDPQLVTVVNRSLLIRQDETLYEVLKSVVERPGCAEQLDMPRIFRTLSGISGSQGRRDEALSWIERGRNLPVEDGKTAFQQAWAWDTAELHMRLEDHSDPQLKELLARFANYYAPKVPQIRPYIEQMLQSYGVSSPWDSIEIVSSEAPSSSGLWSPGSEEPVSAGAGKLWLPGQ